MIGLPLGLLYANAVEWVVHKYVLHGLGKRKDSFFSFHWSNHHKNARRNGNYDPDYEKPLFDWRSRGKEVGGIVAIALVHVPLAAVAPWFTAAVCYASFNYLYRHEKSHVDVEWGKKHMRSHYDHHMGRNQDMNWCVTRPWFDWIMGTREAFVDPGHKRQTGASRLPTVTSTLSAPSQSNTPLAFPLVRIPEVQSANEQQPRTSVPPAA
jgi:hypothetical protein